MWIIAHNTCWELHFAPQWAQVLSISATHQPTELALCTVFQIEMVRAPRSFFLTKKYVGCWYFFSECLFWFKFCLKHKQIINPFFFFFGNAISDFSSWKRVREICASSVLEHDHFSLVGNQNILNYKQNKSSLRWKTFIENVLHFSNSSKASLFCYTSGYLHNLNQCYLLFRACKIIKFLCEKR